MTRTRVWVRLSAYAELLRLHLLPTAAADVLAGASLGGASLRSASLLGACSLSCALYLFGMVTNSIIDAPLDRERYPGRPIPSGRVSVAGARRVAVALLLPALAAGWALPGVARLVAAALLGAVLLYNAACKTVPLLGPLVMGSCRALNLLLGAAAGGSVAQEALLGAAALGTFTMCVSLISSWEGKAVSRRILLLPFGVFFALACLSFLRPLHAGHVCTAAFLLLALRAFPSRPFLAGTHNEQIVHNLLPGLYLVDGFLLGEAGRAAWALLCLAASLITFFAQRRLSI